MNRKQPNTLSHQIFNKKNLSNTLVLITPLLPNAVEKKIPQVMRL